MVTQGVSHPVFLWDLLQEVLALGCQHSSCSRLPIVSSLHGLGLEPHGDITSKHALGPFHVDFVLITKAAVPCSWNLGFWSVSHKESVGLVERVWTGK